MVDWSIKKLIKILHDILVKVDKFILLADFRIFDSEVDIYITIIIVRSFLATKKGLGWHGKGRIEI